MFRNPDLKLNIINSVHLCKSQRRKSCILSRESWQKRLHLKGFFFGKCQNENCMNPIYFWIVLFADCVTFKRKNEHFSSFWTVLFLGEKNLWKLCITFLSLRKCWIYFWMDYRMKVRITSYKRVIFLWNNVKMLFFFFS